MPNIGGRDNDSLANVVRLVTGVLYVSLINNSFTVGTQMPSLIINLQRVKIST